MQAAASTLDAPRGTCIGPARLAFLLRADPGPATAHDNGGKPARHAPSAAAPPDLTRTHHEHMTTRPTRRDRRRSEGAALAWLNNQAALRPPRIRETCQKHGRGYWQGTYGDDPPFTYIPPGCANPRVFHPGPTTRKTSS